MFLSTSIFIHIGGNVGVMISKGDKKTGKVNVTRFHVKLINFFFSTEFNNNNR